MNSVVYVALVTVVGAAVGAGVGAAAGGRGRRGKGAAIGAGILGGVNLGVSTIEVVATEKAKALAAGAQPRALR